MRPGDTSSSLFTSEAFPRSQVPDIDHEMLTGSFVSNDVFCGQLKAFNLCNGRNGLLKLAISCFAMSRD